MSKDEEYSRFGTVPNQVKKSSRLEDDPLNEKDGEMDTQNAPQNDSKLDTQNAPQHDSTNHKGIKNF